MSNKSCIEEVKKMRDEYDINDPYYNTQRGVLNKLIERLEKLPEDDVEKLYEKLKSDIEIIVYNEWVWQLQTYYWNKFTDTSYQWVLERTNQYCIDMKWFTTD